MLGLEGWTPGYMVREKLKREKLVLRGAERAWRYEERFREEKGSIWARRCLVEREEKGMGGEGKSKWEKLRGIFMEEREVKQREVNEGDREEIWNKKEREERRGKEKLEDQDQTSDVG